MARAGYSGAAIAAGFATPRLKADGRCSRMRSEARCFESNNLSNTDRSLLGFVACGSLDEDAEAHEMRRRRYCKVAQ